MNCHEWWAVVVKRATSLKYEDCAEFVEKGFRGGASADV
jgi:hypothetical protein